MKNSDTITIRFAGLCGIKFDDDESRTVTAYLPSGGHQPQHGSTQHDGGHNASETHAAHECTLSVRIEDVDLAELNWPPESIGMHHDAQVGTWRIPPGSHLRLLGTLSQAAPGAKATEWPFKFTSHHASSKTKSDDEMGELCPAVTIARLSNGRGQFERASPFVIHCRNSNGEDIETPDRLATRFAWVASTVGVARLVTTSGWLPLKPGAQVSILNVARVRHPKGLAHFRHYYDLVRGVPADEQVRLSLGEGPFDEPVFDCVPPVGLP